MDLKIYNTLTRSIDPVPIPADGAPLGVYTCGPTVYNRVHVGNLRTFIAYDLLVRTLRARGVAVTWVMNITDVDDKTIRAAAAEGVPLAEVTGRYTDAFLADCDALHIARPDHMPRATELIPEMIAHVATLEANGHTYVADGSVYFRLSSFPGYGRLSQLDTSGLQAGARVAVDEYDKEEARDFVLWKGHVEADGDVAWDSPWGRGRPGWHLECSTMARKYLGDTADFHAGGVDLIFPHHENEIAQSEGATGQPFVRHWFHTAHVQMADAKMSKRLGNVRTLDAIRDLGLDPLDFRYWALAALYRQQTSFTPDDLEAKARERAGLLNLRRRLRDAEGTTSGPGTQAATRARASFDAAITDDLNVSAALGALNELRAEINTLLDVGELSVRDADAVEAVFGWADRHLATLALPDEEPLSAEHEAQIAARETARAAKDWDGADRVRAALAADGVLLEDTPAGTRWRRAR